MSVWSMNVGTCLPQCQITHTYLKVGGADTCREVRLTSRATRPESVCVCVCVCVCERVCVCVCERESVCAQSGACSEAKSEARWCFVLRKKRQQRLHVQSHALTHPPNKCSCINSAATRMLVYTALPHAVYMLNSTVCHKDACMNNCHKHVNMNSTVASMLV